MRDIRLDAYGYSVTCRIAQNSLELNMSRDLVREMALEALGQISNDCDLKLENISVSRSGFKVQFVHDPSVSELSVLQLRSTRRQSLDLVDGVQNYGGTFKKVRNNLGLYYLYITKEPEVELKVSPIEIPRNAALQRPSFNVTPRSVGLSPVCDRKRELYKTLFDEGMDDHDGSESPKKVVKGSPKAAAKRVPPRNLSAANSESKTSAEERTTAKQKSKDTSTKYRPSAICTGKDEETYVPVGVTGGSYSPSKIGRRTNGAEHPVEYVPTIKEKRSATASESAQYVPSKISSTTSTKATYIPTEISSKSGSKTLKTSKAATYKPSRKKSPEVNEYVPTGLTALPTSEFSYKPTSKRISRFGGASETRTAHEEAYEPSGVTDPKLQYRPSQITTLSSQNVFSPEPPLQLRTVRRKRIEVSPEKTDAQKRLRHNKASAPEKCLMSDLMFGWTKENQDRIDKKTYTDTEATQLESEISRLKSLKNLSESHIRYLFYKLEPEILLVAVGEPLRQRHVLFMNEQSVLLDNAIPITAVSTTQLDLIKTLCMDHFNQEQGFNILYVVRVLLPEVIIRMHMLIHGTTYEESDRQTDMGLVDLYTPQSCRGQNVLDCIDRID